MRVVNVPRVQLLAMANDLGEGVSFPDLCLCPERYLHHRPEVQPDIGYIWFDAWGST